MPAPSRHKRTHEARKLQIDTTRDIREDTKEAARRRGMKLGAFVHRALAKEDPGLARVIGE
jgi:hypothetical protein